MYNIYIYAYFVRNGSSRAAVLYGGGADILSAAERGRRQGLLREVAEPAVHRGHLGGPVQRHELLPGRSHVSSNKGKA